ncbi:MAG TPA: GC-type dockerin domain-anchored protein [Phycisphaerales bacterium]|nr:GC-type dockerin domain-anchored protein [Phycisphaerales bacterium]
MRTAPAAVITACLSCLTAAAPGQTFQGLGPIPGGTTSQAMGVSADGSVIVGHGSVGALNRPFRWTSAGNMVNLGVLEGGEIGSAQASEVSDDGSVIAGTSAADGSTVSKAFRWTQAGGMVNLGTLPGGTSSVGNGVSGDGQAVVGYSTSSNGQRAFRWMQGEGMIDLGTIPGYTASLALGANADGSVVVGYAQITGSARPFRWTQAGGVQDLGTIDGYASAYGYACSADGSVVVGRVFGIGVGGQMFRWTAAEGMEGIGRLPDHTSAFAYGVSGDGSVVVGMSQQGSARRAVMWTRAGGMVDLNDYLSTLGVDLSGWTLTDAMDVSVDGTGLVGYGQHDGVTEAWRVELAPPSCPADIGTVGGVPGRDGVLDNNDFVVFIDYFFAHDARADHGSTGGVPGADGAWDNNDFVVFIDEFFAGCE